MFPENTHFHFIGIGGIGMSGLALVLAKHGFRVSGCDQDVAQQSVRQLQDLGCLIAQGHDAPLCADKTISVLVYSTAIPLDHPELVRARQHGIRLMHRAELLAILTAAHVTIAVSGSHGKTTTSSLISDLLIKTEHDPTVLVGGYIKSIGSNARVGHTRLLVAEADESDRSFLLLHPTIAVITNIDLDHLDTYADSEDLQKTFAQFLMRVTPEGKAIVCLDDANIERMIENYLPGDVRNRLITYGKSQRADYCLVSVETRPAETAARVRVPGGREYDFIVPLAGEHNALNAVAALAVTSVLEIPLSESIAALAQFQGVDQRFTLRGTWHGASVYDDYGHHPTEIKHMFVVARKKATGKVIVVFQPQRYSRTHKLWNEFVTVLSQAPVEVLILTDIYPASELPIEGVTSKVLCETLKQNSVPEVFYCPQESDWQALRNKLDTVVKPGDLLLFLGAGKVNKLAAKLVAEETD